MVHNKDENKGGFFAAIEYLFRIEGVSGDFTNKIYNKLIQDNLIAFNPLVASIAISLIMVIILILCYVRIIPLPSDLAFGFLVLGLSFALIPFIYSENLKKNISIKRKILGFKMFLKTTEYYTVKKDEKKFRELMPYFILFRIHMDHLDDMVKYCLE